MGVHNKITRERYEKIKAECKSPKDDCKVIEKYKISQTTARYIRNSKDYRHYLAWSNPNKSRGTIKFTTTSGYSRVIDNSVDRKDVERIYLELKDRIDDIERKEVKLATVKLILFLIFELCLLAMSAGFILERFGY